MTLRFWVAIIAPQYFADKAYILALLIPPMYTDKHIDPQGYISSLNHPHANGPLPLQPSPICLPEPDPVKSAQADDDDEKECPDHGNYKSNRKDAQRPTRYQKV